jgi:hypothetical protein
MTSARRRDRRAHFWSWLAVATPIAAAAWVYLPITANYFYADDFMWLAAFANDGPALVLLRPHAGHGLFFRNLVFYASYQLFDLRAELYFWTVLLTHLLNVWLLFRILRRLTASLLLACFGATLWGTSPLNAGTLEWYSVFGHVLVASALLLVLDGVTRRAGGDTPVSGLSAAVWYVLLLLGSTCFGVGLGVALAFPPALFLLLPAAWRQPWIRAAYLALPVAVIALYFALKTLHAFIESSRPPMLPPGAQLLAQMAGVLVKTVEFITFAAVAAARSFYVSPAGEAILPDAASRITLALLGVAVAIFCWRASAAQRRAAAAMASLCAGAYFAIALGRVHTAVPTPRYHYAGTAPLVVIICLVVQQLGHLPVLRRLPRGALLVAVLAIGAYGYRSSGVRIADYSRCRHELQDTLQQIGSEIRSAAAPGDTAYLDNRTRLPPCLRPARRVRFPGRAAAFLLGPRAQLLDGREVRFVEYDPHVLAWYARWRPATPLRRLLVSAQAAEAASAPVP